MIHSFHKTVFSLERAKANANINKALGTKRALIENSFSEAEFREVGSLYRQAADYTLMTPPGDPAFEHFYNEEVRFRQAYNEMLKGVNYDRWLADRVMQGSGRLYATDTSELNEIMRAYGCVRVNEGRFTIIATGHLSAEQYAEFEAFMSQVTTQFSETTKAASVAHGLAL